MQPISSYINIAAYKFVTFSDTVEQRPRFQAVCNELGLKGTILLTPEGINLFLAGTRAAIDSFLNWLRSDASFTDIEVKDSLFDEQPFNRMLVKFMREIISMGRARGRPGGGRAPAGEAA